MTIFGIVLAVSVTTKAEKDLQTLLRSIAPTLLEGSWAFATVPKGKPIPPGLKPLAMYEEVEGTTLLLDDKDLAKAGLAHAFFCRGISLNVNSSLYAVGFLAAVCEVLAKAAMSINIVSAYHRDYIFVPSARAEEALMLLKKLAGKK